MGSVELLTQSPTAGLLLVLGTEPSAPSLYPTILVGGETSFVAIKRVVRIGSTKMVGVS
jgi:hypothetical protein